MVLMQGAAGLVALGLAGLLARLGPRARSPWPIIAVGLALASLATPLLHPGIDGVHRWIALGPLQVQPAAVALPVVVWFAARWPEGLGGPAALVAAAVLCAVQPDQQAAAALAMAAVVMVVSGQRRLVWLTALAATVAAAITASFGEVLAPVAYVEEVVRRSFGINRLVGLVAAAGLVAVPVLVFVAGAGRRDTLTAAMTALWLGFCVASLGEVYPTPVIGYGLSWVLGFGLSLGLVAGVRRTPA